ncbi:MAG: YifB family Mg chelatase-like AAA ATPase [Clostridia bacterium]|nr:YifB family Mg chelatase-like AAA ATPase [Clostridia bacterium]
MFSQLNSCGLMGMDGFLVTVQTDISNGLPNFEIVGLPDTAVKEAKERVRAAIKNTKLQFPAKRIIINLSPASQKKGGTSFDLPITVSILCATEQVSHSDLDNSVFIGEVSLDGSISSVDGVLPMVIHAFKNGYKNMYVPYDNANEAAVVEGATIYPVKTLQELCDHLNGVKKITPHTVDVKELFNRRYETLLDFSDVKGQENVKRALEIAAAGNHNVLMIGSPGTGKTMLAQRMGSILPDLTFDEALDVTKIHSIAGVLPKATPLITHRPFRSPHHTVSAAGLSGGGSVPRPGELSLAHNGILFLDELPEFNRNVLEILRQPLEDGVVTISRVQATLTYPCNIMLIASMNPCKCGYLGDSKRQCTCTPRQINQYRSKISGPLLDRIDIQVEVPSVNYKELSSTAKGETSAEIKKRVDRTRQIQLERYKDINIHSNSELSAGLLQKYCRLNDTANNLLRAAFDNLGLSARAHGRILKVARTIADLDMSEDIKAEHIAEAIQYRSLDRKYFE